MASGGGEVGNWWEKCTGGAVVVTWGWAAGPVPKMCEGAVDCMVVRVVVSECSEPLGDEKVLPPLLLVLPVSAFDRCECSVSGMVATVGAFDRVLFAC